MMTDLEQEILKNALARKAKGEKLSTVEEVLLREYEIKLKIREHEREAKHEKGGRNAE